MNASQRRCPHCGNLVHPQSQVCSRCGRPLQPETAPQWDSHANQTVLGRPDLRANVRQTPPPAAVKQPADKKKLLWVGLAGAVILCLCLSIAGLGAGGLLLSNSQKGTPISSTQAVASAAGKTLETLPISPGEVVRDARGAILSAPPQQQPQGYQTALVASTPGGEVGKELTRVFGKDITLYNLAPGEADGIGRMELALPAPSPDARLAMLIDGEDLAILPNPPVNGKLAVNLPAAGGKMPGSPNQYMVLKSAGKALDEEAGGGKLAAPAASESMQGTTTGVDCSWSWSWNDCRRDAKGIVFVTYRKSDAPSTMTNVDAQIDLLIAKVIDIFDKFYASGGKYTQANISSSRTVSIKVSSSYVEPSYSPSSGNIYMGWSIVGGVAKAREFCAAAHEIMHWIQDEQYPMNVNYYSGPESWWLEMTAMYGAYFYSTACIETTIQTYGNQTVASGQRAYQAEPFQWVSGEDARYLQGIQFYLGVCTGAGCALSETDLINAINAGSYPYDSAKQNAYKQLAKDTGLYMLGEPPTSGNINAPIPSSYQAVWGYFEVFEHQGNPVAPFIFPSKTGNQFKQVSPLKASVSAQIAHGGEYPLYVENSKKHPDTNKIGLPGLVRILPGAAVWTKLDGQKAVFHDGKAETILAPIGKIGIPGVRILAVAPNTASTLNLTYEVADLSGDWKTAHSNIAVVKQECKEPINLAETSKFLADDQFLNFLSGNGTYILDPAKPDGSHYIWKGTLPLPTVTAASDVTVAGDKIVLKYAIHFPPPKAQAAPLLSLGFLGATGLLGLRQKRRWNLFLAALLVLPLLLSGCTGFAIYGDASGTYTFTQMRFTDPKTTPATTFPWTLTGKAEIDTALDLVGTKNASYPPPCHTVLSTTVTAQVGTDGSVTFNTNNSSKP